MSVVKILNELLQTIVVALMIVLCFIGLAIAIPTLMLADWLSDHLDER